MHRNALYDTIDQLHLAAEQLQREHPTYSRFALILADNAVELLLHRRAEEIFARDRMFFSKPSIFPEAKRREVLGQRFEAKAKFAREVGEISETEMEFILNSHIFRNQLYHAGLVHENVIREIAWHYHELACRLLRDFRTFMGFWHSNEEATATVAQYCGPNGIENLETDLPRIAQQLDQARGALTKSLAAVLSEAAVERVDEITENLEFIVRDAPQKLSREGWIFEMQVYPFIESDEGKALIAANSPATPSNYDEIIAILRSCWKPAVTARTIENWGKRAAVLVREKSPHMALKKYVQLTREWNEFGEQVAGFAAALDREIDAQIDRMREGD